MKNRKIISVVCAISMIFSMLASFTVVNAAAEQGITLETVQTTKTEATVTAKYTGFDTGINSATIVLAIPDGATVEPTTPLAGLADKDDSVAGQYTWGIMGSADLTSAGNVIAQFKITFAELDKNFTCALKPGSNISNAAGKLLQLTDDAAASTLTSESVLLLADPNKKPVEPIDKPTSDPSVEKPVVKDKVDVDQGIELASVLGTDKKTVTVTATYKGFDTGINSATVVLNVPDGATVDVTTPLAGLADKDDSVAGQYTWGIMGSADLTSAGNVIAVFTITLADPVASDNVYFNLLNGSNISNAAGTLLQLTDDAETSTLPASWTMVEGAPFSTNKFALADPTKGIDPEKVKALEDDENVAKVVIAYEAKKGNSEAVYGEDYVAYYNGTKLTKQQLDNYLTGTYEDVSEAMKNIEFQYKTGVTINFQLQSEDAEGNTTVEDEATNAGGSDKPATAKHPKLTVTSTKSTANPGDKVTVTTKLTNPGTDGKLTVKTTSDSLDVVTRSGIKVVAKDGTETELAAGVETVINDTDSIVFTAALKGSVVLTYNYTCTNNLGEEDQIDKAITKTIKIEEKKTPTTGGGSSSDDDDTSGMGPIAGGNLNPGDGTTGVFTDIADVPWALEAITVLASKGIINGRDTYTFDPNANITRAEYCQILIGAINKTQEAADSSFDDVASDAWYYHAVSVASKYGIVSGYGDGNFGPNNLITRQDMALMTFKAAQVMNTNLAANRSMTFADAGEISDYASEAVSTLANAGIINGVSDTEFAPKANATRAQAAVILYQTFVKAN